MDSKNVEVLPQDDTNRDLKPYANLCYAEDLLQIDKTDRKIFLERFAQFLRLTTAKGRPSDDTMNAYVSHIKQFGQWCNKHKLDPFKVTPHQMEIYRGYLYDVCNFQPRTVSAKLTAVRRFYEAAVRQEMLEKNPAEDIYAGSKDEDNFGTQFISAGHLEFLFRLIPKEETEENLRAKLIIALMAIEGLRTVEVHRASEEDIDFDNGIMVVHGKGKRGRIYPREDTMELIKRYIAVRIAIKDKNNMTPLFTSISNNHCGGRISRCGIRDIVDYWFKKADIKENGLSCHLLRHTCGALLYQETKDLRVVQETLRHVDPKTTAKYAHIQDRMANRYTRAIPVKIL